MSALKFSVRSFSLSTAGEEEKKELVLSLYRFAQKNLKKITLDYLKERADSYQIITLIEKGGQGGRLLGFSFSKMRRTPFLFFKIPVFHCGLTVLSREYRGRSISIEIGADLYRTVLKKKMVSRPVMLFAGILFTAKCSTPVSFLKIKRFTSYISQPEIKDESNLSFLSRTKPLKALSRSLSRTLAGQNSEDFILRDINKNGDYLPDEEEYVFSSKKDQNTVRFFEKHILPHNELITVSWFHPVFLWIHRKRG